MPQKKSYQTILHYLQKYQCANDIDANDFHKYIKENNIDTGLAISCLKERYAAKYIIKVNKTIEGEIEIETMPHPVQHDVATQLHAVLVGKLVEIKETIFLDNTKDLLIVNEDIRNFICSTLEFVDAAKQKEIIRNSLVEVLGLSSKDIVFPRKDQIAIKKFVSADIRIEREMVDFKKNGYEKYFAEKSVETIIRSSVTVVLTKHLSFSMTRNIKFNASLYKQMLHEVKNQIVDIFDESSTKALQIAKLALNDQFSYVLRLCAVDLLKKIEKKDKGAVNFIKWFDGAIEMVAGNKVKRPFLYDKEKNRLPAAGAVHMMSHRKNLLSKKGTCLAMLKTNLGNLKEAMTQKEQASEAVNNIFMVKDKAKTELARAQAEYDYLNLSLKAEKDYITRDESGDKKTILLKDISNEIKKVRKREDDLQLELKNIPGQIESKLRDRKKAEYEVSGYEKTVSSTQKSIETVERDLKPLNITYEAYIYGISKVLVMKYETA